MEDRLEPANGRGAAATRTDRSILILAGGESRRLGRDKPWVEIGGRTVLERLLDAARAAGVADVVVAARNRERFAIRLRENGLARGDVAVESSETGPGASPGGMSIRVTGDDVPGRGPVAGFAAGLAEARGAVVVVLGADLPFVDGPLLSALFEAIEADPDAGAIVPRVGARDQSLCAAYRRRSALDAARDRLRASVPGDTDPAVADVLERLTVRRPSTLAGFDEASLALRTRGIDTPEDLAWARARVRVERERS